MKENRMHWSFVAASERTCPTRKEALATAEKYGLYDEVSYLMEHGYSPTEALAEWDIL